MVLAICAVPDRKKAVPWSLCGVETLTVPCSASRMYSPFDGYFYGIAREVLGLATKSYCFVGSITFCSIPLRAAPGVTETATLELRWMISSFELLRPNQLYSYYSTELLTCFTSEVKTLHSCRVCH